MIIYRNGSMYAKTCTRCCGWKLIEGFPWDKDREMPASQCFDCRSISSKEQRIRSKLGITRKRGRASPFSDIEAEVIRMAKAGAWVDEILERFPQFRTRAQLRHFVRWRCGINLRPNHREAQRRADARLLAKIQKMLGAGMTAEEAGRRLGLSKNAVIGYNHRYDLVPLKYQRRCSTHYATPHRAPPVTLARVC